MKESAAPTLEKLPAVAIVRGSTVATAASPERPEQSEDLSMRRRNDYPPGNHNDSPAPTAPSKQRTRLCFGGTAQLSGSDVFFICTWGILGLLVRVYVTRLLGGDCEEPADDMWDASAVCLTANGTTDRRGGALFTDLPANLLGSFLLGVTSALVAQPLPWLHPEHPLQDHISWQKGLATGFCGCLTTFASWNTQMVVMMDGTYTELGSQVASALAGYALGLVGAVVAFVLGRRVAGRIRVPAAPLSSPTFEEEDDDDDCQQEDAEVASYSPWDEDEDSLEDWNPGGHILISTTTLLLLAILLVLVYGDVVGDYLFYRRLWAACLLTPLGALLRAQLKVSLSPKAFPWGTLVANLSGAVLSVVLEVISSRYYADDADSPLSIVLWACKTGLAGGLSTVSTLVKEICEMEDRRMAAVYAAATLAGAAALGLAIYVPLA